MDLEVRVTKARNGWVFSKNRVYESVNVLGRAVRADFVPQILSHVLWKCVEPVASTFRSPSCIYSRHCLTFK